MSLESSIRHDRETVVPRLRRGARVGVAALSSPVESSALERGLAHLAELGLEPICAPNVLERCGLFAGEDAARLAGFESLLADESLEGIFFSRGGYGLPRLLDAVDWDLLAGRPRVFVGYSDVTPLLLEIERRFGWVTFHGPMVGVELARGLTPAEATSFENALFGTLPIEVPFDGVTTASADSVGLEGRLIGGCLSLLIATLGTPYEPDFRDAILFFEDRGEPEYRLDRLLTQLRLSGRVNSVRGLVVGRYEPDDVNAREGFRNAVARFAKAAHLPVVWDLQCGHSAPNYTLPLGLRAQVLEDRLRLTSPP